MPSSRIAAMVLLDSPMLPSQEHFEAKLFDLWPDHPPLCAWTRKEDTVAFDVGGDLVALTLMDVPIPWTDLQAPCAAAWYWPRAGAVVRSHTSHILVVVSPRDQKEPRTEAAMLATRVLAATAEVTPAVAIFWGDSNLIHDVAPFVATLALPSEGVMPIQLWIGFHLVPGADDEHHSLYTSGLDAYHVPEIEVVETRLDPQTTFETILRVAHFLIEKGAILQDGETIGISDDERIPVRRTESAFGDDTSVVRLEI